MVFTGLSRKSALMICVLTASNWQIEWFEANGNFLEISKRPPIQRVWSANLEYPTNKYAKEISQQVEMQCNRRAELEADLGSKRGMMQKTNSRKMLRRERNPALGFPYQIDESPLRIKNRRSTKGSRNLQSNVGISKNRVQRTSLSREPQRRPFLWRKD